MKLPDDLKNLNYNELDEVASQVRDIIIKTVSKNGGHIAPSLGVVELTIAILRFYNIYEDKIFWDVGHQSYAYKILTDRLNQFHTLRTYKGISGFIKPDESPYDVATSGHASVAISESLGVVAGNNIQKRSSKTVAIIGDGAISGGMAFEALNNLSNIDKNLVIVLNDNEMSISPNVGAFSRYLSGTLTSNFVMKVKKDLQNIIEDAPLGDKVLSFAKKIEKSVVSFFTPGSFFESLGITYIGPVNGHNIKDIEKALSNAFLLDSPVLIHTVTVKGKGYKFAEENSDIFHSVPAFDIETGKSLKKSNNKSWTDVFGEKIVKMAETNDKIVAITAAMKDGTGLNTFSKKYSNRFFDVGIAEQHAVTFSAGLAISGMKPYFAVYSTFLQRGFDQIIHDVAISKLPVTFCIDRAGIVGADGATHHGIFDISYLRLIPNIIIMLPKEKYELEEMLDISLDCNSPVAIRYPRGNVACYDNIEYKKVELGKLEVVFSGKDIAIISAGHIFEESYKLYKKLLDNNISSSLINIRFLKPLDKENIINEIKDKKLVVTFEENVLKGGFNEEIQSIIIDNNFNIEMIKVGLPDTFFEHGNLDDLRKQMCIDADTVFSKVVEKLKKIK